MKKFKFKLESLLDVRRHRETMQKMALAKVVDRKMRLLDEKTGIESDLNAYSPDFSKIAGRPDQFQQHSAWVHGQHKRMFQIDGMVRKVDVEIEKERQKLVKANQETRILENLESKHRMLFLKEFEREQQKQLDEIATQRFNRKRR